MSKYKLDGGHSSAVFSVKHMMIARVHGRFSRLEGQLEFDARRASEAKVDVTIGAESIETGDAKRDEHLQSPDFFDVARFPVLRFVSKGIEVKPDGEMVLAGELTIRDVTKSVILAVEGPTAEQKDPWGQSRIGASATTKIKRKDFGLNWNAALEAGGVLVGDEVTITLDVQFIKEG